MEDNDSAQKTSTVRDNTRDLYRSLRFDEWPSPATIVDFGIESTAHLGALQYAVIHDAVTLEDLDRALGNGPAIQALISERNPYRNVTFRTDWDNLPEDPDEF
jgi:hypothetical protein